MELEFVQAECQESKEEDQSITLTVSASDARLILRAVKARARHWSKPDQVNRTSNALSIRKMYMDVGAALEEQIVSYGIKP